MTDRQTDVPRIPAGVPGSSCRCSVLVPVTSAPALSAHTHTHAHVTYYISTTDDVHAGDSPPYIHNLTPDNIITSTAPTCSSLHAAVANFRFTFWGVFISGTNYGAHWHLAALRRPVGG